MENNQAIQKSVKKSPIALARLFVSDFQKEGTITAELKQTVTTTSKYPTKSVSNDLQDNIFKTEEFGFETKDYVSDRVDVAWLDVPSNSTTESVLKQLSLFPDATIYRIVSNSPILHSGQSARLESEESQEKANLLFNQIANRQVLRYSNKSTEDNAGKLILDLNGKPQYKVTFFSSTAKEDQDYRTLDADFYGSPEILAELNNSVSVMSGQTV